MEINKVILRSGSTIETAVDLTQDTATAEDVAQGKTFHLANGEIAVGTVKSGVSTQSQSIFTGYTAPLTWLNSTNNVFTYESNTHNITISGLNGIATIIGNGTKSVTVTIDTTATSNRQTAFTITCVRDTQTLTYNGIEFHYGSDLGSGNCLAVAQTLVNNQIGYIFIESASLPRFSSETLPWNSIYAYQLIGFDFGKWNGTSIGNYFLSYCYSFNQPLTIQSDVTTIGDRFLNSCYSFNQPLTIASTVTTIGERFLYNCYSFDQPLTIPNTVTTIYSGFLQTCHSFNKPLTLSNTLTRIIDDFLSQCYAFNQPLTIPNTVTSIGGYFLSACWAFNQPLTIPNTVTNIGSSFLGSCNSFNQPLTIPNTVTSIGGYFLNQSYSFNQPLTISNTISTIGDNFLGSCYSFNQPLTIPNTVTSIGNGFLQNCYSFNQPLTIPSSVTSIGNYFLRACNSLNQPLTIPTTVTSIGTGFLQNCYSFIYLEYNASVYPTDNNSLSQNINTKTSSSGTGILVKGTHASDLKTALPDRTATPFRKLVLAGV